MLHSPSPAKIHHAEALASLLKQAGVNVFFDDDQQSTMWGKDLYVHLQEVKAPISDAIMVTVARLVDDAQSGTREPSHSDIEFQINRAGLGPGDPKNQGQTVGKAKRVRAVLYWGVEHSPNKAEQFVAALVALVRGKGGFRKGSPNFVGEDAIIDARDMTAETVASEIGYDVDKRVAVARLPLDENRNPLSNLFCVFYFLLWFGSVQPGAKQAVQDFKSAQERNNLAATAWRYFYDNYQAAHPDLPGLQFASDFRIALSKKNLNGRFPWEMVANLATVELLPEERQKAESLNREMLEARRLADQAQKSWSDYWHELVLDHVPPSPEGLVVSLPSGKSGKIPNPWANGIVFTPDFRVAVPF